jgi:hypothetical protein
MSTNINGRSAMFRINHDSTQYVTSYGLPYEAVMYSGTTYITNFTIDDYISCNQIPNPNLVSLGYKFKVVSVVPNDYAINIATNANGDHAWYHVNDYYFDKAKGAVAYTNVSSIWTAAQRWVVANTNKAGEVMEVGANNDFNVDGDGNGVLRFRPRGFTDYSFGMGQGYFFGGHELAFYHGDSSGSSPDGGNTASVPFYYYDAGNNRTHVNYAGTRAGGIPTGTASLNNYGTLWSSNTITGGATMTITNGIFQVGQQDTLAAATFNWTSNNLAIGKVRMSGGIQVVTITNALCKTTSIIFATCNTDTGDQTDADIVCVPQNGFFFIKSKSASVNAAMDISWWIAAP